VAERVALEEGEVALSDLHTRPVREPTRTPLAAERLGLGQGRSDHVLAAALGGPVHPVGTFAHLFTSSAKANLIHAGEVVLAGD
jgi:hypothetical protein